MKHYFNAIFFSGKTFLGDASKTYQVPGEGNS